MPTITTVDGTWTNGVAMDEAELRRADSAMFLGDGSNNGVRGGIVRHGDNSLAVSVNGSDQVTVQSGAVVIPAATGQGVYRASLSAATSATAIDSRNATNPRIDLVVFRPSGLVEIVTGTPGASPSAPTLTPGTGVELARLNVPALGGGAVTVDNAFRAYATGLGGTLYVQSSARLPGSGNMLGQRAIALDTGREYSWTGSAWDGGWSAYTPTLGAGAILGNGTLTGAWNEDQGGVDFWAQLTVGSTTSLSASTNSFSLPAPVVAGVFPSFTGEAFDTSVGGSIQVRTTYASATVTTLLVPPSTAGGFDRTLTGLIPFTIEAGDRIFISGTYQRA